MLRFASLLAALSLGAAAFAQAPVTSAPPSPAPVAPTPASTAAQQVELLAPQLLAFSGSNANFESLVSGLTQGTPVTLTTLAADGSLQIVTFVPGTTLSPTDAARNLEAARQSLISQGIALPSGQQVAVALMGGTLPTPAGSTTVTGVISGGTGTTPIQIRNELAAASGLGTGGAVSIDAANLQALRTGLAQGTPVTLTGSAGNVTFTVPGTRNAFEVNQALQLANVLLAQQGIVNPTPEQLRVALLGGTLTTAAGSVPVQGILQGQVRNTSDSPTAGNTSNSTIIGTSNTPPTLSPAAPGGATVGTRVPAATTAAPPISRR